jgi:hypothetical protein
MKLSGGETAQRRRRHPAGPARLPHAMASVCVASAMTTVTALLFGRSSTCGTSAIAVRASAGPRRPADRQRLARRTPTTAVTAPPRFTGAFASHPNPGGVAGQFVQLVGSLSAGRCRPHSAEARCV